MLAFQTSEFSSRQKLGLIIVAAIALMLAVPFGLDVRDASNGLAYHMDPTAGPLATVAGDSRSQEIGHFGPADSTSGPLGTPVASF